MSSLEVAMENLKVADESANQIHRKVKILQYNVLAQSYCKSSFLPHVQNRKHRSWKDRSARIFRTLDIEDPDLITAQEVDEIETWHSALSKRGYAFQYRQRTGKREGLLLAWKRQRFCRLTALPLFEANMDDLADGMVPGSPSCTEYRLHNLAFGVALQDLHYECPVPHGLFLATTHLYWNPSKEPIKLVQAEYLIHRLEQFYASFPTLISRDSFPLVLAGDFNSLPSSAVYHFITHGSLPSLQRPPWQKSSCMQINSSPSFLHRYTSFFPLGTSSSSSSPPPSSPSPPIPIDDSSLTEPNYSATDQARLDESFSSLSLCDFSHSLNLRSAYATNSPEPAFTNFTPSWSGTIDYIFIQSHAFRTLQVLDIPTEAQVTFEGGGLPNSVFPSDHVPLAVTLEILV